MKTNEQIEQMLDVFYSKPTTKRNDAIIDVLDNDLDEEEIEAKYFDENDPYVERSALNAREWLDGEIDDAELF